MVGIYKIESPTNRVYIGQSCRIEKRAKEYNRAACVRQPILYNSIKKYGFDRHKFSVIHELPKDVSTQVLVDYEILYYELYKEAGFTMLNMRHPTIRGTFSKDIRKVLSDKAKARIISPEQRKKIGDSNRGKKCHSEEFKKKVSERMKNHKWNVGRKRTEEQKENMRQWVIARALKNGYYFTEEAIRKKEEARKLYKMTEEHKRKIVEANTGIKRSEETKRKLTAFLKSRPKNYAVIQKLAEANRGCKHTQEHIDKVLKSRSWYRPSGETKEKMSLALKGKAKSETHIRNMGNAVSQFSLSGDLIKNWDTIKEASEALAISNCRIGYCAKADLKGIVYTSGGFRWKYNCIPKKLRS